MSSNDIGPAPLRVVVVDDQALVRSGFAMILSGEPDIEVVGEASDGAGAVRVVADLSPDVVLMDVQMPGMDGIEATRAILAAAAPYQPGPKIVILTTFDRDDYLVDALRAGASGFLLKNTEAERLVDAVRVVGSGHALLAPEVTMRVIDRMRTLPREPPTTPGPPAPRRLDSESLDSTPEISSVESNDSESSPPPRPRAVPGIEYLTPREREVLLLLAKGWSNAEIAANLYVGEATVKTHVSNVLAKLHLRDRVQAVVVVHEAGLLPTAE